MAHTLYEIQNLKISKELNKVLFIRELFSPKEKAIDFFVKSLVHNHPCSEVRLSQDDINATRQIIEACELLGIKVLDHIILGKNINKYFGLLEKGLIK